MRRLLIAIGLLSLATLTQAQARLADVQARIVAATNAFRAEHHLPALSPSPLLERTARAFAEYMARSERYGHDADGRTPAERARAQGYDYCLIAENIAYQFSSDDFGSAELAQRFERGWENSPPHRENMLDADVAETGIGVAQSRRSGRYYAVQLFGRTMAQAMSFEVENGSRRSADYELDGERFTLRAHSIRTHRVCRVPSLALHERGQTQVLRPRDRQRVQIPG
jgi:uncharacterized protein YkwD